MFVENINTQSLTEYLKQKYQNCVVSDDNSFLRFTNSTYEYSFLIHGVGIHLNFSSSFIELTGKDVLDFLHRVSSNSINDVKPFYKRNTLFLNEKGRFIDRATYLNLGELHLLIGSKDSNDRLLNWVNRYIIMEDIVTKDISGNYLLLDFIGPQSDSFLTLLLGNELKSLNSENILKCSVDGFDFYVFTNHEPNDIKFFRVLIGSEYSSQFLEYLDQNKSVFDIGLVGENAFTRYRIENGIPAFPNEINDDYNPYDVNLLNEVNFKKGCYIGQEVIARLDTYDKVQNKMLKIEIKSNLTIELPAIIYNDANEEVGEITSLIKIDESTLHIGLAVVKKKFILKGENLNVTIGKNTFPINYQEFPKS